MVPDFGLSSSLKSVLLCSAPRENPSFSEWWWRDLLISGWCALASHPYFWFPTGLWVSLPSSGKDLSAVSNWSPGWPTPSIYRAHSPLPHTWLLPHLRGFTCMRLVTPVGMSEFPKRWADWIHRGQCRLSIILAGNFLVLGGPEHGLEGEYISSWESHTGGGTEIVLQSTGNQQLPKHTASLPIGGPQVRAGQEYENSGFLSRFAQPLMSRHP